MSTTKPVALILGAGPNIGTALTTALSALHYRIALASRSGTNTLHPNGTLSLSVDLTSPSSIPSLFTTITEKFGTPPSIVIYNAAALTPPPDTDSVLSVPVEQFSQDLMVNTVAPYVAAMEAVKAWEGMGEEGGKKTFVYTGNALNGMVMPVALMLTLGVGKSASAHWVGLADALYKARGYRFFYADQRQDDGSPMGTNVDGPAHGAFYAKLVQREEEVPWLATFVKDKGYVKF